MGPPDDWRRRIDRPRQSWLRTVKADLRTMNLGLATSKRHNRNYYWVTDITQWHFSDVNHVYVVYMLVFDIRQRQKWRQQMPGSRRNTQLDVTMTHYVMLSTLRRNALLGLERQLAKSGSRCHPYLNMRNVCEEEETETQNHVWIGNSWFFWLIFPDEACYM